jgi:hypothetical protein
MLERSLYRKNIKLVTWKFKKKIENFKLLELFKIWTYGVKMNKNSQVCVLTSETLLFFYRNFL